MEQSTPAPPANAAEQSTALAIHLESLYTLSLDSSLNMTCMPVSRSRLKGVSPLQKMKEFLESKDISPVRYPATVPWSEASARTRRRHLRKARQAVGAVLEEVALHQSRQLWKTLTTYHSLEHEDSSCSEEGADIDVGEVLVSTLADCYNNSSIVRITDIDGHIEYINFAKEYGSKKGQQHPIWRRPSVTVMQTKISLEIGA